MNNIDTMDIFNEVVGRHMGGKLIPITKYGSPTQTFTPQWVVKDMIALLPDQVWNENTTFLDISCKTGVFLIEIYKKLDEVLAKNPKYADTATRRNHILNKQLYGLALDNEECLWYSSRNVYGRIGTKNIRYLHAGGNDSGYSYEQLVKYKKVEYMKALIQEEFGRNMFDVVVGNPPYNNDIYLDFVTLAKAVQTQNICMITPAKWQAKGGPKNEAFRRDIVPYMSKIVYFRDSTDAFDIQEWGGLSYFIIDSQIHSTKDIMNKCSKNKILESEFEEHDETILNLYHRKLLAIIGKTGTLGVGFKQSLYIKNTDYGEQTISGTLGVKRQVFIGEQDRGEQNNKAGDYVEIMQGEKLIGYKNKNDLFTDYNLDKYKCICSIMPGAVSAFDKDKKVLGMFKISIIKPNQVPKGSFPVLKYFDTEDECKSFVSYMNTKLVSFLYYLGCCGTTLTKEFFRFIPDPGAFDHIFTDQELYKKYNLTDEEINIIESVIKERK